MSQILFKGQFRDAIRDGTKTTTLRRWKSQRLRSGSRAYSLGIGWLSILSCEKIELNDLTAADARADGFKSLKELRKTLAQIYPDCASDGKHWFKVIFELEKPKTLSDRAARSQVARQMRAELDKAVRQSGSLSAI
jgi:hypothetical protein